MRYAISLKALAGFLAIAAAGCSGGSANSASVHIRCAGGESFCIISCDLGCTQTGCAVTEIAENQRLKFTFSSAVSVASVNGSSVSLRTATGVAPEGDLMVAGNVLTFLPKVRTVNGISTFGFQRNETYIISITGGTPGLGLTNVAGDPLGKEFTCTVVASRGIIDEDQQPPRVEMISPTNTAAAPRDPTIILRFSELIDTTPLRGTLTAASPVRFTLRTAINNNGVLSCDRDSSGLVLEGIPRLSTERIGDVDVTVVEFKPTVLLPGESCVEVAVTADLRDLSGRAAEPNSFEFFTEAGTVVPITISESFAAPARLDRNISGGSWNNGARPGLIGGDGRHGSFDYTIGTPVTSTEYIFDTTSVVIPAALTLTGLEYDVTDGKFFFTEFTIPQGVTVNFIGPIPPQIHVRGFADIQGNIRLNGDAMSTFNARGTTGANFFVDGQPGGIGGAGAGRGGKGGRECEGTGPIIVAGKILTNGQSGEDVKLLAGHGYAIQAMNTGGRGSAMRPTSGEAAPNTPLVGFVYRAHFAPGGGGGGFSLAGGMANVTTVPNLVVGPEPAGGVQFDLAALSTVGYTSLDHYTVAGSGGGAGATHAFGTIYVTGDVYIAGSGGSGGGGACVVRAGGNVTVGGGSLCEAKGGSGALINARDPGVPSSNVNWGVSSPGGGGSGGSFLFQSGADMTIGGTIDTSGGPGSTTGNISTASINVQSSAGAGSPGFYRLEAAGTLNVTNTSHVPAYVSTAHAGNLTDRDALSGQTSLWYGSNQVFPPAWLHYELDVDTDGDGTIDITYTDTGAPGTQVANDPNAAVILQFQGARLLQSTGAPDPGTEGPWRHGIGPGAVPGISLDSPTGFRFMMTFNRGLFPDVVIRGLRVFARA